MPNSLQITSSNGQASTTEQGGVTKVTVVDGKAVTEQMPGQLSSSSADKPTAEEIAAANAGGAALDGQPKPAATDAPKTGEAPKEGDNPPPVVGDDDPRLVPYSDYLNKIEAGKPFELSPELLKQAAKDFGVPESFVAAYVKGKALELTQGGQQAAVDAKAAADAEAATSQLRNNLHTTFGGEQQFGDFLEWAADGLSPAEAALYNELTEKNPAQAVAYASSLKAKFDASGWVPPRTITGGRTQGADTPASGAVQPYASKAEMQKDINDPRYGKDNDFTQKVYARIGAANKA